MKPETLKKKFIGCMIGSAIGDAVGELAFYHPEERSLREAVDRAPELRYTDDTAMALGVAESILVTGDIDPQHLGRNGPCYRHSNC